MAGLSVGRWLRARSEPSIRSKRLAGLRLDFDLAALGSDFGQKCHTESFSDSRLLREARMLHYGATSRSARIVVTPLHESPGPATAGASLFWTPDFSPGPGRAAWSLEWDGPALISQSRRKILPATEGASASDIGALRPMSKARVIALPASHGRVLPAVKSQRRRQTLLSMPRLEAAWETER